MAPSPVSAASTRCMTEVGTPSSDVNPPKSTNKGVCRAGRPLEAGGKPGRNPLGRMVAGSKKP